MALGDRLLLTKLPTAFSRLILYLFMMLLSGFTNSALSVIFAFYLIPFGVAFFIILTLLKNIKSFAGFLEQCKSRSRLLYFGMLSILFVLSSLLVVLILNLKYIVTGKGFLE